MGLEAHASDLNPVPVLINKALIEIPPKFAGRPPVNPESRKKFGNTGTWKGAAGLAEDIRRHLEHEPVLARGPRTMYRLRKFLRRHRAAVLTILAMVVVTIAAAILFGWWSRARSRLAGWRGP